MNEKSVYTLEEAAEYLGVSRDYLSRQIRAGKLRVSRLGHRTVRVTNEALMDLLRSMEETGRQKEKRS